MLCVYVQATQWNFFQHFFGCLVSTVFLLLLSWYLSYNNNMEEVINDGGSIGIFPEPCSMYRLYVLSEVPSIYKVAVPLNTWCVFFLEKLQNLLLKLLFFLHIFGLTIHRTNKIEISPRNRRVNTSNFYQSYMVCK